MYKQLQLTERQEHIKRVQTVKLYMHMHQFARNLPVEMKIDIETTRIVLGSMCVFFFNYCTRVSESDTRWARQSKCTRTHYLEVVKHLALGKRNNCTIMHAKKDTFCTRVERTKWLKNTFTFLEKEILSLTHRNWNEITFFPNDIATS